MELQLNQCPGWFQTDPTSWPSENLSGYFWVCKLPGQSTWHILGNHVCKGCLAEVKVTVSLKMCSASKRCCVSGFNCIYLNPDIKITFIELPQLAPQKPYLKSSNWRLHSNKRLFECAPLLSAKLYKTASIEINSGNAFVDFQSKIAIFCCKDLSAV